MLGQAIKPTTIKAYIDGDHKSICDSCVDVYRCKKYDRRKKVFYCSSRPKPNAPRKSNRIITQSEEERLCEVNKNGR